MAKITVVNSVETLAAKLVEMREAQAKFATFTQEQVDKIFLAAASAANKARIPLARLAVSETGMGVVEDKVIKNHYASEYIYHAYKHEKTCGVLEEDPSFGIQKIAEPIGVVAAVIPTTNPTSTAIFKTLICLKTRNGIIFSPHPRAKDCTIEAARIVLKAAVEAGATTVTVCDTAGTMLPGEFAEFIRQLRTDVKALEGVTLGVACVDTLSMADACAIAAVAEGVTEVKAAVYPIDTASIANLAKLLSARGDSLNARTSVQITQLSRIMEQVQWMCRTERRKTSPFDSGVRSDTGIFLTRHDDIAAVAKAAHQLGYELSDEDKKYLDESFENGMYVEGYITLKATAGTEVDMSVPYLAFYGDWTKAPLFDLTYYDTNADELDDGIDPEDKTMADAYPTRPVGGVSEDYVSYLGSYYFLQDPSDMAIASNKDHISLSNQDGTIHSLRYVWAGLLRNAAKVDITIKDKFITYFKT